MTLKDILHGKFPFLVSFEFSHVQLLCKAAAAGLGCLGRTPLIIRSRVAPCYV